MKITLGIFLCFALFGIVRAQQKLPADPEPRIFAATDNKSPAGFISDGCTMWFDADYKDCCVQHDWDYSNGSSKWRTRLRADNHLFLCIARKGDILHLIAAPAMWTGVRIFGSELLPFSNKNTVHRFFKRFIRRFGKKTGNPSAKLNAGRNPKSL